jgi:hypothetical protein
MKLLYRGELTRGGPRSWGFGGRLSNRHRELTACYDALHKLDAINY